MGVGNVQVGDLAVRQGGAVAFEELDDMPGAVDAGGEPGGGEAWDPLGETQVPPEEMPFQAARPFALQGPGRPSRAIPHEGDGLRDEGLVP